MALNWRKIFYLRQSFKRKIHKRGGEYNVVHGGGNTFLVFFLWYRKHQQNAMKHPLPIGKISNKSTSSSSHPHPPGPTVQSGGKWGLYCNGESANLGLVAGGMTIRLQTDINMEKVFSISENLCLVPYRDLRVSHRSPNRVWALPKIPKNHCS